MMNSPYQYGEAEAVALPTSSGVVLAKPCRYLGFSARETSTAKVTAIKHLTPDPAAGAEIADTVPAGATWELLAVSVALVQGLTQTPQPILIIDDGTDVLYEEFGASATQAVSTTCRYNWAPGLPLSAIVGATTNCHATAPMPENLVLGAGFRVRTSTLGIGANSNYGPAALTLKSENDVIVTLYDHSDGAEGLILDEIRLGAKSSQDVAYPQPGRAAVNGVYAAVSGGGSVEGSVFLSRE
jgi:hypothetical protein